MSNAIEIKGLAWKPGKTFSIDNLDLTVPKGSIYGFLGPNGSGKTSTIRILMGMAKPRQGSVTLLGRRIPVELPEALSLIGYVPERPHLYPALSVAEAIHVHSAFFPAWDGKWAEEMRGAFRLPRETKIGKLSKGETGKLLILLALAQRPELLVLDEPTDGLDPVVRRDVLTAILDYVSTTGATVFISSHLVHELERFCDWVGILDDGNLVAEMPMDAFKNEIKRIRVVNPPADTGPDLPFSLLGRRGGDGIAAGESWIVRGWEDGMGGYMEEGGATVKEVVHLDLEEGFVELLRAARPEIWAGRDGAFPGPGGEGAGPRGTSTFGEEG